MISPAKVAFTIFGLDVMWYGIMIGIGMILACGVVYLRAPKHGLISERMLDFFLICIPTGVVGARLYYVAFNWDYYGGDFMRIINFRGGGLAIHGGLIFGLGMAAILCYFWKIRPLNLLDLAVPAVALAQSIGRWGNFFNEEAHGGPTNFPINVMIDGQAYHATFLYESVWCLILFVFLIYVDNHRRFEGQVLLLYGMLYSVERFFVEALRTDSLMVGMFKQAQIFSAIVFILCLICYILVRINQKYKGKIDNR